MSKRNKIIAIVVALVLVVSAFVVGTVANTKSAAVSFEIDKTELSAGETATVTVKATANFPVATASIPVFYDKTLLTVSDATATITVYAVSNVTTDSTATDTSKIYADTGIDSDKFGFVLVTYIGGAGEEVPATLENEKVLTFTITAKKDITGEALIKCVTESAKTDENTAGMLYFGTTTSGTTITSIPENVENVDVASATTSIMIVDGEAKLVVIENTTAVIDAENKYVYGITPGTDIETYFTVKNGTPEFVANSSGKTNGTGATINVKNSSGMIIDTYKVVIFGDVNGDGEIGLSDYNALDQYTQQTLSAIEGEAYLTAADINKDGVIGLADYNAVDQYTQQTISAISQKTV